jgi:hypothetical protein
MAVAKIFFFALYQILYTKSIISSPISIKFEEKWSLTNQATKTFGSTLSN